jgi:serine/threonine-protein kinase RsbT
MVLHEAETRIRIDGEEDVITARRKGVELAATIGLAARDQAGIAIAIAEVARNIIDHARAGDIFVRTIESGGRRGIAIVAQDRGPGIPDIDAAMRDGFSTGKGLGLGLSSAQRLMDEFEIVSERDQGTTVTMRKWT